MTATRVLRLLARVLMLVVVGVSGTYLLVYLYRWEWNRALMAGIFFVGAEIALIAALIMTRLDRLARRTEGPQRAVVDGIYGRMRATPTEPKDVFRWLESEGGTAVFVPVLLGAGVVLSALAHVVQRLAISSIDPVVDRAAAVRLAELTPPEGGLVPPPAGDRNANHRLLEETTGSRRTGWRDALAWTVVALIGTLLLWATIDVLADATQARPDADLPGYVTIIELQIEAADGVAGRRDADALVVACRSRLPEGAEVTDLRLVREGVVELIVDPALGDTGSRRFRGCLEDATLELVDADLLWMDRVPRETLP